VRLQAREQKKFGLSNLAKLLSFGAPILKPKYPMRPNNAAKHTHYVLPLF
jgi:hypothetical protein